MIVSPDPLTPAEVELILLLSTGHTVREAAELLGIKYCTARNRTEQLRLKSGMKTTTAAVLIYCDTSLRHMGITHSSQVCSDNANVRWAKRSRARQLETSTN